MVSVFFRCNCPSEGYIERKVDYINQEMSICIKQEMTYSGYTLFRSSGSYMVFAKFDGHPYFHSRQSRTTALDNQNRPVRNNVAIVGNTPDDEQIVRNLALYVLFQEENFYKEIAAMITLHEASFSVDYEALKAYLEKFRNMQMQFTSPGAEKLSNISSGETLDNHIDFIVLEADLEFFNLQFGRVLPVKHPLTYKQMQELSGCAKISFPGAAETVSTEKTNEVTNNVVLMKDKQQENPLDVITSSENSTSDEFAVNSEEDNLKTELTEAESEQETTSGFIAYLRQLYQNKEAFFLGLVTGAIGTALIILTVKLLNKWLS